MHSLFSKQQGHAEREPWGISVGVACGDLGDGSGSSSIPHLSLELDVSSGILSYTHMQPCIMYSHMYGMVLRPNLVCIGEMGIRGAVSCPWGPQSAECRVYKGGRGREGMDWQIVVHSSGIRSWQINIHEAHLGHYSNAEICSWHVHFLAFGQACV